MPEGNKGDQHRLFRTSKVTVMGKYLMNRHKLHETIDLVYSMCLATLQQSLDMRVICFSVGPGRLHPCESPAISISQ